MNIPYDMSQPRRFRPMPVQLAQGVGTVAADYPGRRAKGPVALFRRTCGQRSV